MKRVIMSIVLLASTAVAEGQDRVQQAPAPPSDSQESASPPPPLLLEPVVVTAPPPVSSSSELYHPGPGLRAEAAGPSRRHPAPRAGAHHRSARGRRKSRAVLPARVRRRPRHRRRALRRWAAREPPLARPRPGLCGPALPDPGDAQAGGRLQGAVLRRVRRLRDGRRHQLHHPRHRAREPRRGRGRELGHPALPHAAVSHSRPAEDPLRRGGLHHQWPLRPAAGVHPVQRVRQGVGRAERERRRLRVGLVSEQQLVRLGADPGARRPRGAHRPLRVDRQQRGREHPALQRQCRPALAALRQRHRQGPRLRPVLPARPLLELHLLPERPGQRRPDRAIGPQPDRRRARHHVRAPRHPLRRSPRQHGGLSVPPRPAPRRPLAHRRPASPRAHPGREHLRDVLLAVREVRLHSAAVAAVHHRGPRRHLQLQCPQQPDRRARPAQWQRDPGHPERQGQPDPRALVRDGALRQFRDGLSQQ